MGDESVERNGAKWLLAVLFITVVFGILFVLGYGSDMFKRNYSGNAVSPTAVNGNGQQ